MLPSISYQNLMIGCWALKLRREVWDFAVTSVRPLCHVSSHLNWYCKWGMDFWAKKLWTPMTSDMLTSLQCSPGSLLQVLLPVQAEAAVLSCCSIQCPVRLFPFQSVLQSCSPTIHHQLLPFLLGVPQYILLVLCDQFLFGFVPFPSTCWWNCI